SATRDARWAQGETSAAPGSTAWRGSFRTHSACSTRPPSGSPGFGVFLEGSCPWRTRMRDPSGVANCESRQSLAIRSRWEKLLRGSSPPMRPSLATLLTPIRLETSWGVRWKPAYRSNQPSPTGHLGTPLETRHLHGTVSQMSLFLARADPIRGGSRATGDVATGSAPGSKGG